jgi:hypothetical protein
LSCKKPREQADANVNASGAASFQVSTSGILPILAKFQTTELFFAYA